MLPPPVYEKVYKRGKRQSIQNSKIYTTGYGFKLLEIPKTKLKTTKYQTMNRELKGLE